MRIRKQASKLLGWSCLSPFPSSSSSSSAPPAARCWTPPPPPPPPKSLTGAGAGELQCQLNLSPWDAMEHCHHHCTNSEDELESANEEEIRVLGNGMEAKEVEPMIMCDVLEAREDEMEEEKVIEDKEKGSMRKRREKETEQAVIMKCKKTDGKGWHCKRDAQLPHTLCSYHLAQLRSYRTRFEEEVSDDDRGGGNNRRRKKSAPVVEAGGAGTNYYYYYSVLGPWWGKRRGPVDGINGGGSTGNESRECSESYDESEHSSQVVTGHDDAHDDHGISGDDGDEDDEQEKDDGGNSCNYKQRIEDGVKKKTKKPVKKRGRKPVKARSLKSLL